MRVARSFGVMAALSGMLLAFVFMVVTAPNLTAAPPPDTARFAIIGDYGMNNQAELDVSNLVKSWNPEMIITTGDNNYPNGEASTIDINIGQYYHQFIYPYYGSYGKGAPYNQFFPSLGNHDWDSPTGAQPYLNYFTLPGNERYYDFRWGPVHLFALDSDPREPDGISSTSVQAVWLRNQLASSTAPWKLVYLHHPPYSSGGGGSHVDLRWPYQQWGASVVVAGHTHNYERIITNGFPYIVNGLGGAPIHTFGTPVAGSVVRYSADYGAMLVDANNSEIIMRFQSRAGAVIDTYRINGPTATPTHTAISTRTTAPTHTATVTRTSTPGATTPVPCPMQFADVPSNQTFYTFIRCLACGGIVSGYSDGTFRPNNEVTRGQLSKIVSNAANFREEPGPQIFQDVPPGSTFYEWINRLSRRGYMSGYPCGSTGEPCVENRPYFRPGANATRGQTSKIVANTRGYTEEPTTQTFEDVPPSHTFYREIERLAVREAMSGYECGSPGEPCGPGNRPYFRPGAPVTRGQSAKIVANTFFPNCQIP